MFTLHAYILRELLKSFGLSILALTALFTMGGGLYNVLKVEGVTTGDIFVVLPMLVPIVVTLTMPVAALFATTITYGRLAADNELVAARAAGINVHRLFFSAILLSLFVALFTLLSANLVIPRFMKQIEYFALTNVRDFAFNRLRQRGYMQYAEPGRSRYTLTAQDVLNVSERQLIEKGFEAPGDGIGYFWVEQPTFLMASKDGTLQRFSIAEGGLVQFDTRDQDVKFTLYVRNARDYEIGKRVVQLENQKVGPYSREIPFSPKPAMMRLEALRRWERAPWESPKLGRRIEAYLGQIRELLFRDLTIAHFASVRTLELYDASDARYEITAAEATAAGRSSLVLTDVRIVRTPAAGNAAQPRPPTRYEAARAKINAKTTKSRTWIQIELLETAERPVMEYIARADGYSTQREKDMVRLEDIHPPEAVVQQLRKCSAADVLGDTPLPNDEELTKARQLLRNQAANLQRKIMGVIHFRMSYSLSALVTILMGAALGVMFRGSRALAAFGLACIPFATVTILIAMGKQMTESESSQMIGPIVIWAGLALIGLADIVILKCGVRR